MGVHTFTGVTLILDRPPFEPVVQSSTHDTAVPGVIRASELYIIILDRGGSMKIDITFKNIPSSESLKAHIHERFGKLDKILDHPAEARVVLAKEKLRSIAEINFTCDKLKIHAKDDADEKNMYAAIDGLSEKVRIQIQKSKDKLRRHLAGNKHSIKDDFFDDAVVEPA